MAAHTAVGMQSLDHLAPGLAFLPGAFHHGQGAFAMRETGHHAAF